MLVDWLTVLLSVCPAAWIPDLICIKVIDIQCMLGNHLLFLYLSFISFHLSSDICGTDLLRVGGDETGRGSKSVCGSEAEKCNESLCFLALFLLSAVIILGIMPSLTVVASSDLCSVLNNTHSISSVSSTWRETSGCGRKPSLVIQRNAFYSHLWLWSFSEGCRVESDFSAVVREANISTERVSVETSWLNDLL